MACCAGGFYNIAGYVTRRTIIRNAVCERIEYVIAHVSRYNDYIVIAISKDPRCNEAAITILLFNPFDLFSCERQYFNTSYNLVK